MKKRTVSFGTIIAAAVLLSPGHVLANQFVTGSSSNVNVTLNSSANWVTIRSVTVTIPAADALTHGCVATASADMAYGGPSGVENQYWFVLSRNNANPLTNTGSERMLELVDNKTNGANGGGSHTFYFLGRKVTAGTATADVLDASLSVSCIHTP
ncbi:MAG: hypothetical protein FD130_843 [Halothiobacillaceae bacterium]|nr:MAG: hypothetical protein FD130_843 [Halothiobacillaceae bacterium]